MYVKYLAYTNDIVFIQETWLEQWDDYYIKQLRNEGYITSSQSAIPSTKNQGRPYGGLCWIINKKLQPYTKIEFIDEKTSLCSIQIGVNTLTLIGIYTTTGNNKKLQHKFELTELAKIYDNCRKKGKTLIIGDLNGDITRIKDKKDTKVNNKPIQRIKETILSLKYANDRNVKEFLENNNLIPLSLNYFNKNNISRTTFDNGRHQSMIDYVISDSYTNWEEIQEITILREKENSILPINVSDHHAIQIQLKIPTLGIVQDKDKEVYFKNNKKRLDWTAKNKQQYYELLNDLLDKTNIESVYNKLKDETRNTQYDEAIEKLTKCMAEAKSHIINIQINEKAQHFNKRKQHWNVELSNINKIKRFHSVCKLKYKDSSAKIIQKNYKKRMKYAYNKELKLEKAKKLNQLNENYLNDKSKFWNMVKNRSDDKIKVNANIDEIYNYYKNIFKQEEADGEIKTIINVNSKIIDTISREKHRSTVKKDTIVKIIEKLKNNKACGHLAIENECFKFGDNERIAQLIVNLFEGMINNNVIATNMNIGVTTLLVKDKNKGNKDLNNTRPITVSDVISNIFESYIQTKIKEKYNEADQQLGFKGNSSTIHAIFALKETIYHAKLKKKKLIICFIDFSKAFDKISKDILMYKLRNYLEPALWALLYRYVKTAEIYILNNNERTSNIQVSDGVKQGGNSSPILFSIYIDEMIKEICRSNLTYTIGNIITGVLCYADDTAITCDSEEKMNRALEVIVKYCKLHRIKINKDKCEVMYVNMVTNKNKIKITIDGETLKICKNFKYLGVIISQDCNEQEQIKLRINKCHNISYSLNKIGFSHSMIKSFIKSLLYKMYCRSTLLYGIETTHINKVNLIKLKKTESIILKKSTAASKYDSTKKLLGALKIKSLEHTIRSRKINMFQQLIKNRYTRMIIITLVEAKELHTKSFIHDIIKIWKENEIELDKPVTIFKISEELKERNKWEDRGEKEFFKTPMSQAIRFILDNRLRRYNNIFKLLVKGII
jgi:hypothetical protein